MEIFCTTVTIYCTYKLYKQLKTQAGWVESNHTVASVKQLSDYRKAGTLVLRIVAVNAFPLTISMCESITAVVSNACTVAGLYSAASNRGAADNPFCHNISEARYLFLYFGGIVSAVIPNLGIFIYLKFSKSYRKAFFSILKSLIGRCFGNLISEVMPTSSGQEMASSVATVLINQLRTN